MPNTRRLGAIGLVVLVTACGPSPEPYLEASPSVGGAGDAPTATQAPTTPVPNEDESPDIYVVTPETGAVTPLLSAPGSQENAELSPDGRRVVYESRAPGAPSQVFVMEADGTTRKLTQMKGGASDPTWSPDGTQIAFVGTRRRDGDPRPDADIFVMQADGSHIRRLVGTLKDDGHPDWSPDGSRIVFHSRYVGRNNGLPGGLVRVASVRTRTITRLTRSHTQWAEVDPAWSPDGRSIAFSRFPRSTINRETPWAGLWLIRANGTRRTGIRKSDRKSDSYDLIENPSWSPSGRSIVVQDSGGSIGIIDVDTERIRTVLTGARGAEPSWGPDGILVSLSPDDVAAMPQAPTAQTGWDPTWEPSWPGRPDATIVLTGSRCEQEGDARVLDPGVLTIEFVNDSHLEGLFRVQRLARGQRLGDLRDTSPLIGRRSSTFLKPSVTRVWSSSREITSGQWAVVCWKDRIAASNGFLMEMAGVAGPIEIG